MTLSDGTVIEAFPLSKKDALELINTVKENKELEQLLPVLGGKDWGLDKSLHLVLKTVWGTILADLADSQTLDGKTLPELSEKEQVAVTQGVIGCNQPYPCGAEH